VNWQVSLEPDTINGYNKQTSQIKTTLITLQLRRFLIVEMANMAGEVSK